MNIINKLIYTVTLTLIATFFASANYAGDIPSNLIASDIHSDAHPNNSRIRDAYHHFEVFIRGFDLSALLIEVPEDIEIDGGKEIEVTNQLDQIMNSQVSINGRKITLLFSQAVPAGTTLSIKLKGIRTPDNRARNWQYHIFGIMAQTNQEIPLGLREVKTYK